MSTTYEMLFEKDVGERMQRVLRLRFRGRVPLAQIESWVPEAVGNRYTAEDTDREPMTMLMERAGVVITSGRFTNTKRLSLPISISQAT